MIMFIILYKFHGAQVVSRVKQKTHDHAKAFSLYHYLRTYSTRDLELAYVSSNRHGTPAIALEWSCLPCAVFMLLGDRITAAPTTFLCREVKPV